MTFIWVPLLFPIGLESYSTPSDIPQVHESNNHDINQSISFFIPLLFFTFVLYIILFLNIQKDGVPSGN
jgi:hypothetical protein